MNSCLSLYRQLEPGLRVVVQTKRWRRGCHATVLERLDDRRDGMARYAVRIDPDSGRTSDLLRCEIRPLRVRVGKKNRLTTQKWEVAHA